MDKKDEALFHEIKTLIETAKVKSSSDLNGKFPQLVKLKGMLKGDEINVVETLEGVANG